MWFTAIQTPLWSTQIQRISRKFWNWGTRYVSELVFTLAVLQPSWQVATKILGTSKGESACVMIMSKGVASLKRVGRSNYRIPITTRGCWKIFLCLIPTVSSVICHYQIAATLAGFPCSWIVFRFYWEWCPLFSSFHCLLSVVCMRMCPLSHSVCYYRWSIVLMYTLSP